MKIARYELDHRAIATLFALGAVPGFLSPLGVWLVRICQGAEMSGDFWLGIACSYGVTFGMAVLLMWWPGEGVHPVAEQEDQRQRERTEALKTFHATLDDPLFGPPLRNDGFEALEIVAGSKGEGGFYLVRPKNPPLPKGSRVLAFHHPDGFHECQREFYRNIIADFGSIWKSLYPKVNQAYREMWNPNQDIADVMSWDTLKIGKDEPGAPLCYMLSVTHNQDEYADIWVRGSVVTKVEFWM